MKKRKRSLFKLIFIVVLVILFMVFIFVANSNLGEVYFSPVLEKTQEIVKGFSERGTVEDSNALSSEDIAGIQRAKEAIPRFGNGHPDYSELYSFLETKKGNLGGIKLICREFNPIYCLKKACQQNLELRSELAVELELRIREKYRDVIDELDKFVQNHKEECLLGIPQFAY